MEFLRPRSRNSSLANWRRTISRYLNAELGDHTLRLDSKLVMSAVGPLLFPAWDTVMLPYIEANQSWEQLEVDWMAEHLSGGMVALVVGANVGYHTIGVSRAVGSAGRVIAFEPDDFNCQLLKCNLALNNIQNVCVIQSAVGDYSGTTEFTTHESNAGDHRSYRRLGAPAESVLEKPIVRVDDLEIARRVDFVLSDTQAFDHRVIGGMSKLILRDLPLMLLEFWPEGIRELGDNPEAIIEMYKQLPYTMEILEEPSINSGSLSQEFVSFASSTAGSYVSLVLAPYQFSSQSPVRPAT